MVLRPYQFYAVEALVEKVKNSNKNGYVWHTTGSGKTLTSFKASQILMNLPQVKKVVFVVDRKDLDYQTTREFNSFSKGSIDGTDNTKSLVAQFTDDTRLIVTTIQKLNTAISKKKYLTKMEKLIDERIVFIFDECHRSQFGETHNRIKAFFNNIQLFGFTGTPIFAENSVKNELGRRTTKELFDECLHKYVITDAIKDDNVLKFSVEYVGRYKQKETATEVDIEVEDIDTKELMESDARLDKIADYIITNHKRKTHNKEFTAMFCVSSVDVLIKYYELFKKKKSEGLHNLNIATIFSYGANEDDKDADGILDTTFDDEEVFGLAAEPLASYSKNIHTREKLDEFIVDYNKMYGTKFSTKDSVSYYNYYNDISKKVKERKIDILLVVNMFLTGFDSKTLNTLYVDKNLKYHGLIQAYSRTNRILNDLKSQGNIIVFRNLKQVTDQAIALFSNKDAKDVILMEPFENYIEQFNEAYEELLKITPTVDSVNDLKNEEEVLAFVIAFRKLMRIKNILKTFSDFKEEALDMTEQSFEDYKSKYLDLHDESSGGGSTKTSILDDVDFELELIHQDEINVTYILQLLASLKDTVNEDDRDKQEQAIIDLLTGQANLRSKRELIEIFIKEHLIHIEDTDSLPEEFEKYWSAKQILAFEKLVAEENLSPVDTEKLIDSFIFSEREPLRDELLGLIEGDKPKLLERKSVSERILNKIQNFINTFVTGIGG